ncbi:MAG TPA: succinylglutamate desuccinylase/aspartoacylase family protein [candidate division Zixibacteria bacterium]|nr:succinylglutamate desuccinylase/aspartoacylase family protein [candidate division Zixibacteria bacterium]
MIPKHHITGAIVLLIFAVAGVLAAHDFISMWTPDKIYPSAALTEKRRLSDYFSDLKGTNADTDVLIFQGDRPGATVMLLGGTHPNEPAAFIAATVIAENIVVNAGRVIIVPQACASGFTCTDPFEGYPQSYTLDTKSGPRRFRFGSRVASPLDSWPDPLIYTHYPSGQRLSGFESRNLNRSYPGRPNGTFSERTAYGIMEILRQEQVDVAFDLHEAAPEIPIINAIVYHEKGEDIALAAVLDLEMLGMSYAPELSPTNFHGLSHREWGDATDVIPFLMETSNPIQGRLRGQTNAELVIEGVSPEYKEALESGALRIVYTPTGEPLKHRVGRHLQGFQALLNSYNMYHEDNPVEIEGLPSHQEIMDNGLGNYLH